MPLRFVAATVAGGVLAAAGQQALAHSLPAVLDGATHLLGASVRPAAATVDVPSVVPAAPAIGAADLTLGRSVASLATITDEPRIADAAALVKAAGLQAAAGTAQPLQAALPANPVPANPVFAVGGGVQMIHGPVTSGFGGRWGTVHEGLDIGAPIGTPIHVPEAGTVISSGPASGFGLWVRVQHADGTITVYGHINRSFVTVGQQVNAGDVIAETGNRGQSTGPHLHIGVMENGQYVNPQPWLDEHGIGY